MKTLPLTWTDPASLLDHILAANEAGVWELHFGSGLLNVSDRWLEMLGLERANFVPHISSWEPLCHPDDLVTAQQMLVGVVDGSTDSYRFEHRLRHTDGRWIWIHGQAVVAERDQHGQAIRLAGSNVDITARKLAEPDRIRAEARLNEAQEIAKIGNWEWDPPTGRLWWSRETYRLFGSDPALSPPNFEDHQRQIHPEDRQHWMSTVSKAMADGNPFVMEFRAVHPDGTIVPILGRGRCDVDESGRIVRMSGTCQDITDQKCSEAALFEAKRIAEAAAAAKAAFLAQMSHEIRTPMNGIQGLSELLSDTPLDTKQKDYLLSIRRTADHLLSIINHILDFSKLEAGKVTLSCAPFDLESAMAQLGRMIMPLMEETCLSFQVVVGPDCPKVLTGDQTRLNQILLNLLSNAAKFTPAGGTVRFEVHPCAPPGEGTDGAGLLLPCLNGVF